MRVDAAHPLHAALQMFGITYRYTAAWFSCLVPNLVQILLASSSIEPIAEPSLPPLGPLEEDVYVFMETTAWLERLEMGSCAW
jgi:hypothetical protein